MSYRIGSFNVRKLSFASNDETLGDNVPSRRAYEDIGRIIMDNFDIVALQEVMNETVLSFLFPPFCGWCYSWKKSRSKSDESDEGYGKDAAILVGKLYNSRKYLLESIGIDITLSELQQMY